MPVRVELTAEAVQDLRRYAASGNLPLFLKRLIHLEEAGNEAGLPLGRDLVGWRKMSVGDRNWRIIFSTNPDKTVATVWVIGDRDDAECYDEALRRLRALDKRSPEAPSLAAVIFQLSEAQRSAKRPKRRRG